MAGKFYAVRVGITPGIYKTWDECKSMVDGYSGAQYKSFKTMEEAKAYLGDGNQNLEEVYDDYAFVDGSFNASTGVYGYGGFLYHNGEEYVLQGSGNEPSMAEMRNVAGEISGSMAAIQKAIDLGLTHITIFYDYMGIECWAKGTWKRNKEGTIAYYDYIQSVKNRIKIDFCKVEAHTGIEGNERADQLAKEAAGIN